VLIHSDPGMRTDSCYDDAPASLPGPQVAAGEVNLVGTIHGIGDVPTSSRYRYSPGPWIVQDRQSRCSCATNGRSVSRLRSP